MLKKCYSLPLGIAFTLGVIVSLKGFFYWPLFLFIGLFLVIPTTRKADKKKLFKALIPILIIGLLRGGYGFLTYKAAVEETGDFKGYVEVLNSSGKSYVGKVIKSRGYKVVFYSDEELMPGSVIKVEAGYLKLPQEEMNEGGFSYRKYLKNKGIFLELKIKKSSFIRINKGFRYYIFKYKSYYLNKLKKYVGENYKYIDSIFLGNNKSLEEKEQDNWRNLGISHLQAVSGAQVGVLIDFIMLLYIISPGKNIFKSTLFLAIIFTYGFITGSPSVWRTISFYLINLLVVKSRIEGDELSLLILSGSILVFINPGYLYDIAFQLSFGIAFGVSLYKKAIGGFGSKAIRVLLMGGISFLFSLPILLYNFQSASIMTILATPLAAPIIQLIILISGLYFLFPFLINIFIPLNFMLNYLILFLTEGINKLNQLPLPLFDYRIGEEALIFFYYIFLIFYQDLKKRRTKILAISVIIALTVTPIISDSCRQYVEINFINVGQGDAILIVTANPRKVILVDGGKSFKSLDYGEREVIPYLRRKGIFKIDYIISTHGDNDHKGGLDTIVQKLYCHKILVPNLGYDIDEDYREWQETYPEKIVEIEKGKSFRIGEILFEFLAPDSEQHIDNSNQASIVLEISYEESSLLLTGDCEVEVLEGLVEKKSQIDIVKAPHHGSLNSYRENIYKELGVKEVIFSVGENSYGHPAGAIIDDLIAEDISYHRTDEDKDIVIKMYKNKFIIKGHKSGNNVIIK